jgi:hypothetical protein
MLKFANDIAGGQGNLIVPALQSPNFVTGVSGWQITRTGHAEFNDIVIRGGTVIGGTALYYNGTPAAGNLLVSIAATFGNDAFGNFYLAGITVYDIIGPSQILALNSNGIQQTFYSATTQAGPTDPYTAQVNCFYDPSFSAYIVGGPVGNIIRLQLPVTATDGSLASPTLITTDTATAASSYGTDWAASGSGADGVQFTLGNDGWVTVLVDVHTTGASPATELCAIPSGYVPAVSVVAGLMVPYPSGTAYAVVASESAAQLQVAVPATNGVRYTGMLRYPMTGV